MDYGNMTESLQAIDSVIEKGHFKDNWASLSEYKIPQWYKDAKFGVFIHWGVYSVPAFASEWYSRDMYIKDSCAYKHHIETYGLHKDFGYKDFIPMFKAEKFNAEEWADLFQKAGARYVMPVAEHHDGFQMYGSDISDWNSVEMGPKRDVLGELSAACVKRGIKDCASNHRVEHWFFMGHGKEFESDITEPLKRGDFYWPSQADPTPTWGNAYSEQEPSQEFLQDWLLRCCEIVDKYRPKIMFFDWWIQHVSVKPYLKKFAAYYYNRALEWGEEVAINYKYDAFKFGCAVVDVERGQFADIKPYFWQTDTAVGKKSWCYTTDNEYKKAKDIICDLVDIVSKNGTMLLNIGPKADGTICDNDRDVLLEIGEWLGKNGEAIYGTATWQTAQEGPTEIAEGHFTDNVDKTFTPQDIRFTTKGEYLYAAVLNYPSDGMVKIKYLAKEDDVKTPVFHGVIENVEVLGFDEEVVYTRTAEALEIQTKNVQSDKPVVFKILIG